MEKKPEIIPIEKAKLMEDSPDNNHYTLKYKNIEGDNEIEWEFYMNEQEHEVFNKIQSGIVEMKNKANKKILHRKKLKKVKLIKLILKEINLLIINLYKI